MTTALVELSDRRELSQGVVNDILKIIRVLTAQGLKRPDVQIPSTYDSMRAEVMKLAKSNGHQSAITPIQKVQCPNSECGRTYDFNQCVERLQPAAQRYFRSVGKPSTQPIIKSKLCCNRIFGKLCGHTLVELVDKHSGIGQEWKPKREAVSIDIAACLQAQFASKSLKVQESILEWQHRDADPDVLADVYDGEYWKDLEDEGFFGGDSGNLALQLNIDWFTLGELGWSKANGTHHVGIVYAAILNLPRHLRYKSEYMIQVAFLPDEPSTEMLSGHLEFAAKTLHKLANDGIEVAWPTAADPSAKKLIHVRLGQICSDIPATRKICGFLSHAAIRFCHLCTATAKQLEGCKPLTTGIGRRSKTANDLRTATARYLRCGSKNAAEKLAKKFGFRPSVIQSIPFFDPINDVCIDAMHNLFMGIGKDLLSYFVMYVDADLLNAAVKEVGKMLPIGFPTFPTDFSRCIKRLSAYECMLFVLHMADPIFSSLLERGEDPQNPSSIVLAWKHVARPYIQACRLLTQDRITLAEVDEAEQALNKFFVEWKDRIERGNEANPVCRAKPNFHLALHLPQMVRRFGPLHAQWAFSFERENGRLSKIPSNGTHFDKSMCNRFLLRTAAALASGRGHEEAMAVMGQDLSSDRVKQAQLRGYRLSNSISSETALLGPIVPLIINTNDQHQRFSHSVQREVASVVDDELAAALDEFCQKNVAGYDGDLNLEIIMCARLRKCGVLFSSLLNSSSRGSTIVATIEGRDWISEVLFYFKHVQNGVERMLAYVRDWFHLQLRPNKTRCGQAVSRARSSFAVDRVFAVENIRCHGIIYPLPTAEENGRVVFLDI